MIFVNNGGGGYSFFNHIPWFGLTIADIIFPSFVFIMGMSTALSIRSRLMERKDFVKIGWKIVTRSFKLFALGIMLNTDYTPLSEIRIPGVLQRFSVSYAVVASLHLLSIYRGNRYLVGLSPSRTFAFTSHAHLPS
jgi:heparan-alpha-glucosaminide N-acetyltransferase